MTDPIPTTESSMPPAPIEPLLRTLSPLLHTLNTDVRGWLDRPHRYPLSMIARASLEGMAKDLDRQANVLDIDRPVLVIMLMGGTGVGKSTLFNALAGSEVAQASFARPTTKDPVVYYHQSIKPETLDPALRHCRLVPHDKEHLIQKVIVDTPDLDSNDLANREKLQAMLPVADVVLYVGSQEKYHDQIGWDLFKEQRKRRAFAFVLNKWDRCIATSATGVRPDEDLLKDLTDEGFAAPLLFRTTAQAWVDADKAGQKPTDLPQGEQFTELKNWLELGLSRLEIEALKARGVGQLLTELLKSFEQTKPPDLTAEAERTQGAWENILHDESNECSNALVSTLEPYAAEIEHHFRVEAQQRYRGIMALYTKLTTKIRYAGTSLRDHLPFVPKIDQKVDTPTNWNLAAFAHECTRVAGERVLNQRSGALVNRLLVEADRQRFPVNLLNAPVNEASRSDWQARYDRALMEALAEVEQRFTHPKGKRRVLQFLLVNTANILPELVFIGSFLVLLYRFFVEQDYRVTMVDLLLPFALTLLVVVIMHLMNSILMPMRWSSVRGEFQEQLLDKLKAALGSTYQVIPTETAQAINQERQKSAEIAQEIQEVKTWLETREQASTIQVMYGK